VSCAGWGCAAAQRGNRLIPGFVFVSLPAPKGEKYAFSVPITSIYSILVYSVGVLHVDTGADPSSLAARTTGMAPLRSSELDSV
jgi:hypothetical protein